MASAERMPIMGFWEEATENAKHENVERKIRNKYCNFHIVFLKRSVHNAVK